MSSTSAMAFKTAAITPPSFDTDGGGGAFSVCGGISSVVAAALGADVTLIAMRFSASSQRAAFLTRFQLIITPATLGAAAGVAGILGLRKFTTATPSGGTDRTPIRKLGNTGGGTDLTYVQDKNSALTVTSVAFAEYLAMCHVPLFVANAGGFVWDFGMDELGGIPLRLDAGDGLALYTVSQMAATQTWLYSWNAQYYEKPS